MAAVEGARVRDLFLAVLDAPPAEREDLLRQACAGEGALRAGVEALLVAYAEAGSFLEQPAVVAGEDDDDALERLVGERVGAWRLAELIGRGGMGAVYMAERDDGAFRQRVAIKLLRPGLASAALARRFLAERDTLSRLEHPHIARLIDGGTTGKGLPYLVMEHVAGTTIDSWCDARRLDVEARLRLFLQVCAAVQHAHRHLIVHRDIKPSNILVNDTGEVKLLDFGIAKLLPGAIGGEAGLTRAHQLVLTPEYASPEQMRGEPVTTATDVYALGLLLYELLTGRAAHRPSDDSLGALAVAVCDTEVERGSSLVLRREPPRGNRPPHSAEDLALARGTTPARLRRRLRGDLDTILQQALRKDPFRRYPSVEQLGEDLRRHLEGMPVAALRDRVGYRAAKFVRRHRVAVAAAAVAVLGLVAGLGVATWQAQVARHERARAEARLRDVRQLASTFLFEFHDAIADLPGATPARRLVVTRALEYLDRLAREAQDDEALQRDLAAAYERVGAIQGDPQSPNLGDSAAAKASFHKALLLRARLAAAHPADLQGARELAAIHQRIGDLDFWIADTAGAQASYDASLALRRGLLGRTPRDPQLRRDLAQLEMARGAMASWNGRTAVALHELDTAVARLAALAAEAPNRSIRQDLAWAHLRRADARGWANDLPGALEDASAAEATLAPLREGADATTRRLVWLTLIKRGEVLLERSPAEGVAAYRQALAMASDLAAADPRNAQAQRDLAVNHSRLGEALRRDGKSEESLRELEAARGVQERLAARDPMSTTRRMDLANTEKLIGDLLFERKQAAPAVERYDRALALREQLVAGDPRDDGFRREVAVSYATLGAGHELLASQRRGEERAAQLRLAIQFWNRCCDAWAELARRHAIKTWDVHEPADAAAGLARAQAAAAGLAGG